MGLEGVHGNESILYHLQSPCRVATSAPSRRSSARSGCRTPTRTVCSTPTTSRPRATRSPGRWVLMWNDDVEIALCRPTGTMDYFLPERRGRRGRLRPRGLGDAGDRLRRRAVQGRRLRRRPARDDLPLRAERSGRAAPSRVHDAGLIEIPRRYRNQYGQILEGAPYYHRDIHPPAQLNTHRDGGEFHVRVRVRNGIQDYVLDYHPFDVVGWDGYLYPGRSRSTTSSRSRAGSTSRRPRTRPRGAELRHLLVLPAQARLRPARRADPVPPLEPAVRGDHLLRLGQLRLAEGRHRRVRSRCILGPAARTAAGPRRALDRPDGDRRARRHVRHVPPAPTIEVGQGAGRRGKYAYSWREDPADVVSPEGEPTAPASPRISSSTSSREEPRVTADEATV